MEKRTFTILGLSLIAGFATMNVVYLTLSLVFIMISPERIADPNITMLLTAVASLSTVPVFWLIGRRLPTVQPLKSNLSGKDFAVFFFIAMGSTYIFNYIGYYINAGITYLLTGEAEPVNAVAEMTETTSLAVILVYMCIIAPIIEEFIFRKILFDRLRPFGDRVAILYSGLAFGLYHMNLSQIPYAIVIGFILGYAVLRTGRIRTTILLHAFLNFIGSFVPTLIERNDITVDLPPALQSFSDALVGADEGFFSLLFTIMVFVLMGVAIVLFLRHRHRINFQPAPFRFTVPITGRLIVLNWSNILYILTCVVMSVAAIFLGAGALE